MKWFVAPFLALCLPAAALAAEPEVPSVQPGMSFLGLPLTAPPAAAAEEAAFVAEPAAVPVRPRSRPAAEAATPAPVARTRSLAPRPAPTREAAAPARRIFVMPWQTGVYQ